MTIRFRPLARQDFPLLSEWLRAPHVARWWGDAPDPAALEAQYGPAIDGREPVELFVVELDGQPAGMVQRYRLRDFREWDRYGAQVSELGPTAGVDFFLGRAQDLGRGIGTAVIRAFVQLTFATWPDIAAVVADPEQANVASWRALEKAGFERVWAGQLSAHAPPSYVYRRSRPG